MVEEHPFSTKAGQNYSKKLVTMTEATSCSELSWSLLKIKYSRDIQEYQHINNLYYIQVNGIAEEHTKYPSCVTITQHKILGLTKPPPPQKKLLLIDYDYSLATNIK